MRFVFRPLSVLLSAILVAGLPIQAQESSSAASGDVQELHVRMVGEAAAAPTGKHSRRPLVLAVTDGHNAPVPSATVLVRLPSEGPSGAFNDGSRVAVLYTDMSGQVEINNIHWGSTPGTAVVRVTASKGSAHAGLLVEQVIGSAQQSSSSETVAAAPKAERAASVQPGQPQTLAKKASMQEPTLVASNTNSATVSTPSEPPGIVINNHPDRQASSGASGRSKKWLWIGLGAAAAAGAAFAVAGHGSGSNSSAPASGTATIGSPSVSIGHP